MKGKAQETVTISLSESLKEHMEEMAEMEGLTPEEYLKNLIVQQLRLWRTGQYEAAPWEEQENNDDNFWSIRPNYNN